MRAHDQRREFGDEGGEQGVGYDDEHEGVHGYL